MEHREKPAVSYWPYIHVQVGIGSKDVAVGIAEEIGIGIQHLENNELHEDQGEDRCVELSISLGEIRVKILIGTPFFKLNFRNVFGRSKGVSTRHYGVGKFHAIDVRL